MSKQAKIDAYHALVFSAGVMIGHCLVAPFSIQCVMVGLVASSLFMVATKITSKCV